MEKSSTPDHAHGNSKKEEVCKNLSVLITGESKQKKGGGQKSSNYDQWKKKKKEIS